MTACFSTYLHQNDREYVSMCERDKVETGTLNHNESAKKKITVPERWIEI